MKQLFRFLCLLQLLGVVGCGTGPKLTYFKSLQTRVEFVDSLHFVISEESVEPQFIPNWQRYTEMQTKCELELIDWAKLGELNGLARDLQTILDNNQMSLETKRLEAIKKAKGKEGDLDKILDYCVGKSLYDLRRKSMDIRFGREVERLKNLSAAYAAAGVDCTQLNQAIKDMTSYREPTFEAGEVSFQLIALFDPKQIAEVTKEQQASTRKIDIAAPRYRYKAPAK